MQNKLRKFLIIAVIGSVVLGGGGYAGWLAYKSARQARLIKQAREYMAKTDARNALLTLQRALRYNPRDIEACRLMAQLAEANRSPAAMVYRSRVVELDPSSTGDRLALAQTALSSSDYATATNALAGVSAAGKNTAAYHSLAGTVATAANQTVQADAHFLEAARLEPQNAIMQFNLAMIRLYRTNTAASAEARSALKQIAANATNSALRCQALRELTIDAMRYKQAETALAYSQQVLQETNSAFRDRILRLDVLRETKSAEFKPTLATFQREAATNPASIYELGIWQMGKTSSAETLTWLRSLPHSTQTNQVVAMVTAECFTAHGDWRSLQAFLEPQNWGELEFIRHAFKTRALRGQDLNAAARAEWELAFKAADYQKGSLVLLLRQVAAWQWLSEWEELLWAVVNRYPDEKWAFQALAQTLYVGGRTRPLMSLYTQEVKRSPLDPVMKNNLAMTALLLEANELKPHELAREVYQTSPTNTGYASTYAFALHLQQKDAEALKVFQTLEPRELEDPSIAGYYGLILKATGDKQKAQACLDSALKGRLLPEERKLFESARSGL